MAEVRLKQLQQEHKELKESCREFQESNSVMKAEYEQ